jgi:hypothetical protein
MSNRFLLYDSCNYLCTTQQNPIPLELGLNLNKKHKRIAAKTWNTYISRNQILLSEEESMSKIWRSRKIDSKTKNWGVVVSIIAVQSIVPTYSGWIKQQIVSSID